MNFKIRDTTWFIGAGSSVLCFMIGLFTAFFLSGLNVFFGNLLLFMVAVATILVGSGLLTAAVEVHLKNQKVSHPLLVSYGNAYAVAVGEDRDSLQAHEILNSLTSDEDQTHLEKSSPSSISEEGNFKTEFKEEHPTEVFNLEESNKKFTPEIINGYQDKSSFIGPSKEEILAKVDAVQKQIAERKAQKIIPAIPTANPTVHHGYPDNTANDETGGKTLASISVITDSETNPVIEEDKDNNVSAIPSMKKFNLDKIILVGDKGIDPLGEEFKALLEQAVAVENPDYVLRLKGKTYGLGARGIKTVRKNTEFTSFTKTDIKKMLKKFN